MTAAASELERFQELLRRAAQGQAELGEVQRSLSDYWREHGQSLATAAAAVGEQTRGQMLAQLYAWRAQLGQQLASTDPASTDPATDDRDSP
jgi:hypothetical protein